MPPFRLSLGVEPRAPILISSPHSGSFLPVAVRQSLQGTEEQLRMLDDGPVHALFAGIEETGVSTLAATFRRAFVDLNRDPAELDPAVVAGRSGFAVRLTLRARAGLGVIPSRLDGRPLFREPLQVADVAARLHQVYFPYHRCLAGELERLRAREGIAILLDLHSMPGSVARIGDEEVDVAVGDCFGRSADRAISERVCARFREHGLRCRRNRPFAGGHITATYGRPRDGLHALQIEFRRQLFMDERSQRLHSGADRIRRILHELVRDLSGQLRSVTTAQRLTNRQHLPEPASVAIPG